MPPVFDEKGRRIWIRLKKKELEEECRSRGLYVKGNKVDLADRLTLYDAITAEKITDLHHSRGIGVLCLVLEVAAHIFLELSVYLLNLVLGWAAKVTIMDVLISWFSLSREEMILMSVTLNTVIQYAWFINAGNVVRRCVNKGVYMYLVDKCEKPGTI